MTMGLNYPTKKALKAAIGDPFMPEETSMFGNQYNGDGKYVVVGPDPYRNRKWFAEVEVKDGKISKVK